MCFPPPRVSTKQDWLEEIPAESRGLRIIEVVFFLITYKNRDRANHQPCNLLHVTGPPNSLKKARITSFPTVLYCELLSSLRTILLWEREGGEEKILFEHINKIESTVQHMLKHRVYAYVSLLFSSTLKFILILFPS